MAGTNPVPAWRRFGPPLLGIGVYCTLAYLAYAPAAPLGGNRIVSCTCGDPVQQAWFLAWTPYALLHGHNVFFTAKLNYPPGVNLASNTLMPVLGLIAAPFTLTIGPAGALVLMMRLAFAASATAMFLVLRRWTAWWPAAFAGGLLYGFSSYMAGQGLLHLNLLFVPLPPLLFALMDELLIRRRWRARTTGVLIGLVAGLQFLISSEILATSIVIGVIGLAILALRHPSAVPHEASRLFQGVAWAIVPFAILAGYPLYEALAGPYHIVGPTQPERILAAYHADLLGPFVPTVSERFAPASWFSLGDRFGMGNYPENGSYLGIPLVVLLIVLAISERRAAIVRFTGVMALAAFIICLGPRLAVGAHLTSIPLPYEVLTHVPLLNDAVPDRYSLYLQLFVAVLVAVGLDRIGARLRARRRRPARHAVRHRNPWRPLGSDMAVVVVAAVAIVPLVPRFPEPTVPTDTPEYVTTGGLSAAARDSVVLTYPYTELPWNEAMLWQADTHMSFSLMGEYVNIADRNGTPLPAPPLLDPPAMQTLFTAALGNANPGSFLPAAATSPLPATKGPFLADLRTFLARYHVEVIILQRVGYDPSLVVTDLTTALDQGPTRVGGLYVWSRIQHDLRVDH